MKNTMEKIIRNTILSLALSLAVFIGFGIGAHAFTTTTGTVTSDNVKVRKSASTSSDQVSSVKKGATVDILGEETDESGTIWYKIKVKGDETGYIRNDLVSKSGGSESSGNSTGGSGTTAVDQKSVEVLAENGTVRQGAGTDKDAVGKVKKGDIVTITGETKGADGKKWYEISFGENGSKGFVRSDLVSETPVVASKSVKSEQTDAPSDDGSPDVIADLAAVDDVMGIEDAGDETGDDSSEDSDMQSGSEPTAPTEAGDGQYTISYEDDTWYLTDFSDAEKPQKMQIPQIVKLAKQAKEFHDKLAVFKKVIIAVGSLAVVLLVLAIILGIRLRDAAYYDEEEDEEDEDEDEEEDEYDRYSAPSKKRSRGAAREKMRDDSEEDARPKRRRSREEDEDEPRESRRVSPRRAAAEEAPERPSRRTVTPDHDDDERVARPSRGERPMRRRADDQVEERPSRSVEERTVRPSRRDDDSMYGDSRYEERQPSERRMRSEEVEKEEPSSRRAKNFLGDDDDFEFEFLDLDDDDR